MYCAVATLPASRFTLHASAEIDSLTVVEGSEPHKPIADCVIFLIRSDRTDACSMHFAVVINFDSLDVDGFCRSLIGSCPPRRLFDGQMHI